MKILILTASLLSMLFMVTPAVLAQDAHQHDTHAAPAAPQMETEQIDASVQKMQELRQKIESETKPETRKELMHQYMKMMRDGMGMMSMMGGQGKMMEKMDHSSMPMNDRMEMMEKKMGMMEKMMGKGGCMMGKDMMMGGKGMMGGHGMMMGGQGMAMGGAAANPVDDRLDMMEKKMMMMQELINGILMQQEPSAE